MQGQLQAAREFSEGKYIGDGNPGPYGGGTYTNAGGGGGEHEAVMRNYEEIFGPAARDIKYDPQRSKRHQRWHLPDTLSGYNPFLTDRIDGLITDATNSPFTSIILPYKYIEKPDAKLKWNVWSFDEGMASRVPYESAARVLTQSKRSFSAYTVRQGLAIVMEHNFMASPEGMQNFRNQIKQMVGSIQYTNDLDVHMALIQAPSYAKTIAEKYHTPNRTPQQLIRQYVDLFGIVQKNPNALDLLIEEGKAQMRDWGSQEPDFLLCNSKLTLQLTMSPERTSYATQGAEGMKRLRQGPDIPSYRGVNIVKSRSFSLEKNMPPRDVLRRRVRVAEYYWVPAAPGNRDRSFQIYDQGRDSWVTFTFDEVLKMSNTLNKTPDAKDLIPTAEPVRRNSITTELASTSSLGLGHVVRDSLTTITLDQWNIKPYNLKIALLSSLGGLMIKGDGALHCDTVVSQDEAGFVQLVQQATNFVDASQMLPHVFSSAWIGGGLFNDTTAHLCKGNSYSTPLCNWAALDVERMVSNSSEEVDKIFQFGYTANSFASLKRGVTNSELHNFMPYQPNNFAFTMSNAHSLSNSIDPNSNTQRVASMYAGAHFNEALVAKLLGKVDIATDIQARFHDFLVPFRSKTGSKDAAYTQNLCNRLTSLPPERNPFNSVLMCLLMARIHPVEQVRLAAERGVAGIRKKIDGALSQFLTSGDAGMLSETFPAAPGGNIDARWVSLESRLPVSTQSGLVTDEYARNTLFALIAAKRLFCGAPRFHDGGDPANTSQFGLSLLSRSYAYLDKLDPGAVDLMSDETDYEKWNFLLVRPNIEHEMLGVILGRGGESDLGATLWGQTELSCYDDSQNGIWGMSYKYHERAQVFNERNMVRTWDIAFDGYNGGMGSDAVDWGNQEDLNRFRNDTEDLTRAYSGKSLLVFAFPPNGAGGKLGQQLPNPLIWYTDASVPGNCRNVQTMTDPENIHRVASEDMILQALMNREQKSALDLYMRELPDFSGMHTLRKIAGNASAANESTAAGSMAFQGSLRVLNRATGGVVQEIHGSGHLGHSYVGVAPVRDGKGVIVNSQPHLQRLI